MPSILQISARLASAFRSAILEWHASNLLDIDAMITFTRGKAKNLLDSGLTFRKAEPKWRWETPEKASGQYGYHVPWTSFGLAFKDGFNAARELKKQQNLDDASAKDFSR